MPTADKPGRKTQVTDAVTRVKTLLYMNAGLDREARRAIEIQMELRAKQQMKLQLRSVFDGGGCASTARASQRSSARSHTSAGTTASSLHRREVANDLISWVRELDLDPALLRSFERALRPHHRRSSFTGRSGALSSARSSDVGSEDDIGLGGRVTMRVMLRRMRRALRALGTSCVECWRPVTVARQLLGIYALCLLLAGASIFLPEGYLRLDNEDNQLWARIAWQAALVDALIAVPLLAALRLAGITLVRRVLLKSPSTQATRAGDAAPTKPPVLLLTADAALAAAHVPTGTASAAARRPSFVDDTVARQAEQSDPKVAGIRTFLQRSLSPDPRGVASPMRPADSSTVSC